MADCAWTPLDRVIATNVRLTTDLAAERAEVKRLTQLHERIAASDDVAKAYQQVYFEDFPTVKQAVAETLLAKEQLAAERAEIERLRAEIERLRTALKVAANHMSMTGAPQTTIDAIRNAVRGG